MKNKKEISKMENIRKLNPNFEAITKSAILIDKVHSCADCPIRRMAMERPHSIFARLHIWHKKWWPGWKAHQARTCAYAAKARAHS
jgi:hypothetical protein